MTSSTSPQPPSGDTKPNRGWYQFSLRTLLLFMLLATLPMAWYGKQWRAYQTEQRAVEAIQKVGGHVYFDEPPIFGRGLIFPFDHKEIIWGQHIKRVSFYSSVSATDSDLVHLRAPPQLLYLDFDSMRIGDSGPVHLKSLTQLQDLILSKTEISDAGLVHLQGLTQLNSLRLRNTRVTDAGLIHLYGMTQLEILDLRNTRVSSEGIAELQKNLPECTIVF